MFAARRLADVRSLPVGLGVGTVVVAFALLSSGPADARVAAAGGGSNTECGATVEDPVQNGNLPALRNDLLCLLNEQRRKHARKALRVNKKLGKAANTHVKVMVREDCLSHLCPGEPNLEQRIAKTGYFNGARRVSFAENTGCAISLDSMVANWMASKFHRLNILGKKYKDVGIAISKEGVPSKCSTGYATFTLTFGFAKR